MARITVEDCLDHQKNRFSLVRLAARRAKQLLTGSNPVTDTKGNRAIVSALREIADGKVSFLKEESSPAKEFSDPLLEELDLAVLTTPTGNRSASASTTTAESSETTATEESASEDDAGDEDEDSSEEASAVSTSPAQEAALEEAKSQ